MVISLVWQQEESLSYFNGGSMSKEALAEYEDRDLFKSILNQTVLIKDSDFHLKITQGEDATPTDNLFKVLMERGFENCWMCSCP